MLQMNVLRVCIKGKNITISGFVVPRNKKSKQEINQQFNEIKNEFLIY